MSPILKLTGIDEMVPQYKGCRNTNGAKQLL